MFAEESAQELTSQNIWLHGNAMLKYHAQWEHWYDKQIRTSCTNERKLVPRIELNYFAIIKKKVIIINWNLKIASLALKTHGLVRYSSKWIYHESWPCRREYCSTFIVGNCEVTEKGG